MNNRLTTVLFSCIVAGLALTACHDDSPADASTEAGWGTVSLTGGEATFSRLASYERLRVSIDGYDAQRDGTVTVTSTAEWLSVVSDTLATDSTILLTTTTNDGASTRTASLVFTATDRPALRAELPVSQLSKSDGNINGTDAQSVLYVGYGYDIYAELDNPMSVRTKQPILDLADLTANCDVFNFEPIHDSHLSTSDTRSYYAGNIYEMATVLTATSNNSDIEIAGSVLTCQRALDAVKDVSISEQNIGYGVMTKTVASRALDLGALRFLRKIDNETANSNRLSLTLDFRQRLAAISRLSGQQRRDAVVETLLEYGTHIVVQADLGGKIDYAFTMDRSRSYRTDAEVDEEVRYTIGQLGKNDRTQGLQEVSSEKNVSGAIQLWGGSQECRQQLQADISGLDHQGQIPPEHMQRWLASISYSAALASDDNLDVIHFELLPVWDLVPPQLRGDFIDATLILAQRSDCKLPATALGTDIYAISPAESDLFGFNAATDESSLCRLLYYEDQPVLQVCSEYVPKIRTDQRVTVAYPIYKQHVRLNEGLFVGDGIHQPAMVSFSGSDSYVNPIDSLKPGRRVNRFYYVNGTLLMKNPSTLADSQLKGKQRRVRDDVLTLYSSDSRGGVTHEHPIVKIGSTFWTRRDIDHQMYFAEQPDGKSLDEVHGGVLYTQFQWAPNNEFLAYNAWTWGYKPNTFFDTKPNTSWFLPTPNEVKELQAYLGFNPKALFRGQASGFNAQFNGYYGWCDIENNNVSFSDGQREQRYQGALNVICSNSSAGYSDACLLVLKPDYTIQLVHDKSIRTANRMKWRDNFYPVRAVRGWMFEYPTLSAIKANMR